MVFRVEGRVWVKIGARTCEVGLEESEFVRLVRVGFESWV